MHRSYTICSPSNQVCDVHARRYEKGSVGGRLKSLHIGDHPFELGGSMVYEGNDYIRRACRDSVLLRMLLSRPKLPWLHAGAIQPAQQITFSPTRNRTSR